MNWTDAQNNAIKFVGDNKITKKNIFKRFYFLIIVF